MNWRNPKTDTPEDGSIIMFITLHKGRLSSIEINRGPVFHWNGSWQVELNDETGLGGYSPKADEIEAWIPAEEFTLPEWISK